MRLGGNTIKVKGTPVLGSGIFPTDLRRFELFPDTFSVGDFPASAVFACQNSTNLQKTELIIFKNRV
jgi:hypothetical protein